MASGATEDHPTQSTNERGHPVGHPRAAPKALQGAAPPTANNDVVIVGHDHKTL